MRKCRQIFLRKEKRSCIVVEVVVFHDVEDVVVFTVLSQNIHEYRFSFLLVVLAELTNACWINRFLLVSARCLILLTISSSMHFLLGSSSIGVVAIVRYLSSEDWYMSDTISTTATVGKFKCKYACLLRWLSCL